MKNLTLCIAAILLFTHMSLTARAQTFGAGIQGGLNVSAFSGEDARYFQFEGLTRLDRKAIVDLHFGAFGFYKPADYFAVNLDVLITRVGNTYDEFDTEFRVAATYLELPLTAQFYLPSEGAFKPKFFIGPYVRFGLQGEVKTILGTEVAEFSTIFRDNPSEPAAEPLLSKTAYGAVGGVGFDYFMDNGRVIRADIRYNYGMSKVFPDIADEDALDIRSSAVTLSVGIGITK